MKIFKRLNLIRYYMEGLLFRRSTYSEELLKLKNSWAGKPAIIVGNGPSLRKTPLDEFSGVNSIGMNKINLIFDDVIWRPSIITVVNRHVIDQNRDFYCRSNIPIFIAWQNRYFLRKIKTPKNIKFFLNSNKLYFSEAFDQEAGAGATVTFKALQLAYFLGANPVIIVGVDHTFQAAGEAHKLVKKIGDDQDHFHPNYFADGVKWNLPDLDTSELGYKLALEEFVKKGRIILDATVGGKLDIFPKVSIEEALKILHKKS